MPTPSKFTADVRQKIIQALSVGASRSTAAAIAGVDEAQIRRWIKRGSTSDAGTNFREFYEEVRKAEASPRMRALGIIYKELPDNPGLAWKYIERMEPGYAPPLPELAPQQAPLVINLSFTDGSPMPTWIEAEVIDAPEVPAIGDGSSSDGPTDQAAAT